MKNKIIFLIGIIVFGLIYYFAIYKTTDEDIRQLNSEITSINSQIEEVSLNIENLQEKANEIQEGKESGSMIYDYDNMSLELSYLSNVVKNTTDYNISFEDPVCEDGTYVRRNVTITFICNNYYIAKDIIMEITNCPYRTIFNNVLIVPTNDSDEKNPSLSKGSQVSVEADLTFVELYNGNEAGLNMKGGESDKTSTK